MDCSTGNSGRLKYSPGCFRRPGNPGWKASCVCVLIQPVEDLERIRKWIFSCVEEAYFCAAGGSLLLMLQRCQANVSVPGSSDTRSLRQLCATNLHPVFVNYPFSIASLVQLWAKASGEVSAWAYTPSGSQQRDCSETVVSPVLAKYGK